MNTFVHAVVCVSVSVSVCVCVCVRESVCVCVCERECVCVCERERECVCVLVCACVFVCESVCVCVCVCECKTLLDTRTVKEHQNYASSIRRLTHLNCKLDQIIKIKVTTSQKKQVCSCPCRNRAMGWVIEGMEFDSRQGIDTFLFTASKLSVSSTQSAI
jgi:hypothetical protein